MLRGYVDTALLRDVIERHAVSHPVALRWMVRQLLGNAGGSFSVNKFHNDLRGQGIPVAKDTLHAYLAHLEDAILIRALSVAAESKRRRIVNPAQGLPDRSKSDSCIRPIWKGECGACEGDLCAVGARATGAEVAYVRTKGGFEVDFLARYPDGQEDLIQVCADLDTAATRVREA